MYLLITNANIVQFFFKRFWIHYPPQNKQSHTSYPIGFFLLQWTPPSLFRTSQIFSRTPWSQIRRKNGRKIRHTRFSSFHYRSSFIIHYSSPTYLIDTLFPFTTFTQFLFPFPPLPSTHLQTTSIESKHIIAWVIVTGKKKKIHVSFTTWIICWNLDVLLYLFSMSKTIQMFPREQNKLYTWMTIEPLRMVIQHTRIVRKMMIPDTHEHETISICCQFLAINKIRWM